MMTCEYSVLITCNFNHSFFVCYILKSFPPCFVRGAFPWVIDNKREEMY